MKPPARDPKGLTTEERSFIKAMAITFLIGAMLIILVSIIVYYTDYL